MHVKNSRSTMNILVPYKEFNVVRLMQMLSNVVRKSSKRIGCVGAGGGAKVLKYSALPSTEKMMALTAFEPEDNIFLVVPETVTRDGVTGFKFVCRLFSSLGHLMLPGAGTGSMFSRVSELRGSKTIVNVGVDGSGHHMMFTEIMKKTGLVSGRDVFLDHSPDKELMKLYPGGKIGAFRMATDPYYLFTKLSELSSSYFVDLECGSGGLNKKLLAELYPGLYDVDKVARMLRANKMRYVVLANSGASDGAVSKFLCVFTKMIPLLREVDFFDISHPVEISDDISGSGIGMHPAARAYYLKHGLVIVE